MMPSVLRYNKPATGEAQKLIAGALRAPDFHIGQPRGVVDGHMDVFPAHAARPQETPTTKKKTPTPIHQCIKVALYW